MNANPTARNQVGTKEQQLLQPLLLLHTTTQHKKKQHNLNLTQEGAAWQTKIPIFWDSLLLH